MHLKKGGVVRPNAPAALARSRARVSTRVVMIRAERDARGTTDARFGVARVAQDRLTSVIIPLGAVVLCTGMLLKGMDDLYNGKNKKPGF